MYSKTTYSKLIALSRIDVDAPLSNPNVNVKCILLCIKQQLLNNNDDNNN